MYACAGDRLKVAKACLAAGVRDSADFEGMDLTRVAELEQLTADEMTALQTVASIVTADTVAKRRRHDTATKCPGPLPVLAVHAASSAEGAIDQMLDVQRHQATVNRVLTGSRKAAEALVVDVAKGLDAQAWAKQARAEAVVLSAPHSLQSTKSGLRAWIHFADRVLGLGGRHLPPPAEGLAAWSQLFRCAGTYSNYIRYVAMACDLAGVTAEATRISVVSCAKTALRKQQKAHRERRFLGGELTARLVASTAVSDAAAAAMLFLMSYTFLLRVPSEALPLQVGDMERAAATLPAGRRSAVGLRGGNLVLTLNTRQTQKQAARVYPRTRLLVCSL